MRSPALVLWCMHAVAGVFAIGWWVIMRTVVTTLPKGASSYLIPFATFEVLAFALTTAAIAQPRSSGTQAFFLFGIVAFEFLSVSAKAFTPVVAFPLFVVTALAAAGYVAWARLHPRHRT